MDIREQIQEGQHRANLVAHEVRMAMNELPRVALETFKQELEAQLKVKFIPYEQ